MRLRLVFLSLFICFFVYSGFLSAQNSLHEALYYHALDAKKVQCVLCPRRCVLADGQRGFCGVRQNSGGRLYSLVYGKPCSLHVDPIEKKPLFHFMPGSSVFSLATVGCNLRCKFCQNWQISQVSPDDVLTDNLSPRQVVDRALASGAPVIAYTYTEPTVFFEYMLDIARLAQKAGLKNVMHSAGYINEEPLRELCEYLDAANIDLKGFNQRFYTEATLGGLEDVLRTLKILKSSGVWLEITNLILPGLNDDPAQIRKMCSWIRENLGVQTPLHFSRFWPMHKLIHLSPTPVSTLEMARQIAREEGLRYVYIGNAQTPEGEKTFCPACGKVVVDRSGYVITAIHLEGGRCSFCGQVIDGAWLDRMKN